jgi:hypothetical protein
MTADPPVPDGRPAADPAVRLALRTAFEALRAGVPNRAAIELLGSVEDVLEDRFEAGLDRVWSDTPLPGLLFAGGFGAGKSHLLGFLREAALRRNVIVSRVSISKETPLSAPLAVVAAALRDTLVPGHTDDAMTVALAELQRRPTQAQALERQAGAPEAGLSPVFAALAYLLGRQQPAELLRRIETFLAGGPLPGPALRAALAEAGARGRFDLAGLTEARLAGERERFAPLLFRAAGFAGWCVLLDEVELIGRYAPLQRARAYAELAIWLGLGGVPRVAGLQVAAAITDDFAAAVIEARQDAEKLPERLRLKGLPAQAELALAAIRAIAAAPLLRPPAAADLQRHATALRRGYSLAYGWEAPPLPPAERRAGRTIRHHVRGWITQWDVQRLLGQATGVEHATLAANYAETVDLADLAEPPEAAPDGGS